MSTTSSPSSPTRWRAITIVMLLLAALSLLTLGALSARDTFLMRGIPAGLPEPIQNGGARLGINVELERYDGDDIEETLSAIKGLGIEYVKQPFYYREDYQWETADRMVSAIRDQGLSLVPLLDGNSANGFMPPEDVILYADWAGEFAQRYGDSISHYIIWDEPNLTSHWGGQPVNPNHYAALLTAAAERVRANDPDAMIVAAPLAPTTETGPDNLSETLFLQALYEAGAADSFDIVAAKPYGFDTGPDDRAVEPALLNFSRPIMLRELMVTQGDGHKAIWAGNWGWNSLPEGWTGRPSIWGQTSEAEQAAHTTAAFDRARREWPWMGLMFLENWEPNVPVDNPRWGFSIANRQTAAALTNYLAAQLAEVAMPGFHLARPDDPAQEFSGDWEFSPEFGADIGQSGDAARFTFWGTDVGLRVRRADFRARLYATVDGQPANALPRDENGAMLILTSPDPTQDFISTEWVARDLPPGPHTLEITAARGWDQWALNGFSVGYTPTEVSSPWIRMALWVTALVSFGLTWYCARRAEWGATGRATGAAFSRLSDRAQLLLTAGAAALVALTGWLTWGSDALGIYRRLGDAGQLVATAAAAAVFYVTPSFVLFALALGVLFILLVLRPAWGVVLIALTMPFYVPPLPKPILGYSFSPVEIFTLVATGAWLTRFALDKGMAARRGTAHFSWPKLSRPDWAVVAFLIIATLSLFVAEFQGVALSEWRVVILEPVLFYMLLRGTKLHDKELWIVLDAFVVSGLIIALYGLWQYATGQDLITAEGGLMRLRSIYGSPNNVALYLDRLLPLLVAILLLGTRATHGSRRLLYGLALAPVALALLLTFSKGALFLGIPASLIVVFWVWQRRAGRRTWPWLVVGLMAGTGALLVASRVPALAARLDFFGATGVFRVNLWRSAVNMFTEHPWLGVGLDNFLYLYRGRYILDAAWQEPNLSHPHNIILDFATRLGLLGLLAGGWLIWEAFSALRRGIAQANAQWLPVAVGFAGSLAAMLAHGLVDHSFFLIDLSFVFFLILGVAVWIQNKPNAGD
ncbi:MAG TPA: O-antigen ligase family protein [Promineifilum sp.]|nr:O-antigen ligase family protein [Promineifilum sp.]HRQ14342.1 O-antigen ligase family protein [Promineifilum sp.]